MSNMENRYHLKKCLFKFSLSKKLNWAMGPIARKNISHYSQHFESQKVWVLKVELGTHIEETNDCFEIDIILRLLGTQSQ